MRIIQKGTVFRFYCDSCGTDFVEGKSRVVNYGFFYACECPVCGNEARCKDEYVKPEVNDEHYNSEQDIHTGSVHGSETMGEG